MAGASAAVMQKIMAHDGAAKALATTMQQIAERAAAGAAERESAFRPGGGLPDAPSAESTGRSTG